MDLRTRFSSFNIILFGIALLITIILTYLAAHKLTPLSAKIIYKKHKTRTTNNFYRDFDNDGFSESYTVKNDLLLGTHYLLFEKFNGTIIDQFNIKENIDYRFVFFGDYTQDGTEDCFVFTIKKDSLFLYAYDIALKKEFLHRHFLMKIPDPHPHFIIPQAMVYDIHQDNNPELLFFVHAGLAEKPRGLYAFDFKQRKIVQKYENLAAKEKLLIYDMDGDGLDEIILGCKATGNVAKEALYSDWKNWIFILDQNFKEKFSPLSFGAFPSAIDFLPMQMNNKNTLLVSYYNFSSKYAQNPFRLLIINNKGRIQSELKFKEPLFPSSTLLNQKGQPFLYFTANDRKRLLAKMNMQFKITKELETSELFRLIRATVDMNQDGEADIIVDSIEGMSIFDQDFNLLCKMDKVGNLSVRYCGLGEPPQLGINEDDYFYQIKVEKNPIFTYLPFLSVIFFLALFGLLKLSQWAWVQAYIFASYFHYSISQTTDAVMFIKPNGHILYFNRRLQELLNLSIPFKSKMPFQKLFKDYGELFNSIKESITHRETVRKDFVISKGNDRLSGEIRVIPFKSHFNFIYAYLVIIKDFSKAVLSDRQKTWSRTVRKMAHDIKTPLGSVLLNIERIQQKLQDATPQALELTQDDFQMTIAEIKRIHEMTKNFLKFTNLEEPNMQPVQLNEILENVLIHFRPFLSEDLKIELNLEESEHWLKADAKQLEMAFQIFIENSIDALKGKGKILITSVLAQNLEHHFQDELEIEIADNGPGFSEEVKNRMFEPFFSTKKDGTGMGLAIAQKIITDHGGRLEVISKENFGAVFRITLPVERGVE